MSDTEENVRLEVQEIEPPPQVPEKDRYKCDVCNINFYKRWYSPSQNARAYEGHLKRHSHKHNVERRAMGLEPERLYNITTANKQLGELVERFGARLDDLEALIRTQTRRLESLESGSIRSWAESAAATEPDRESVAATESAESLNESSHRPPRTPMGRPDTASLYCQDTTRLGPPQLRDWEDRSDAYSEDTTITDTTEAEYPPLHPTSNRRGEELSYNQRQIQKALELSFESESSRFGRAVLSRSHAFRPTENETNAVYSYDGNNYAYMTQITNMLERLIIWVKQHYSGSKLTKNLQYIHRTQSALNLQIRQRLNQEPRDAEDTELLLDRLYTILEYDWEP